AESRQVLVADVVGFDRVRAEQVLSEQGLRVGTVTEEVSEQRAHTVLRTSPSAGTAVLPGGAVDLVLAKASVPSKRVPNVVGFGRSVAEWMLVANGFKVGSVTEEESSKSPDSVLRSNPVAGTEVQPGSTVDLVVAKAPSAGSPGRGNNQGGGTGTTATVPKGIRKDG
ncbi:MAG: PASTA domain-containing protein, partial [Pseudonocardiaceae bacterium]